MQPLPADGSSRAHVGQIEEARQGSRAARGELLEACRNYLLLVANRELAAEFRAKVGPSDLVQETFVQAQQHFGRFQGNTEVELRAWLARILVNRCHDAHRSFRQAAKGPGECAPGANSVPVSDRELPVDRRTPSQQVIASEEALGIAAAIEKLSDVHQQVLRLRYWEDLTFERIGRQLGRTDDAARKLWYRAIERLGEELEQQYGHERRSRHG